MNHWLRDATQAAHYARHGWPTADQRSPKRQNHMARQGEYEAKLKDLLRHCAKPISIPEIAVKAGIPEATAKKYVSVLFKRRLLDREKRGFMFYYWCVKKSK